LENNKWLIAALLLITALPACYACISYSVTIRMNSSAQTAQFYLLYEGKYSIYDNNSLYYFSHNDSGMNIKLSDNDAVFRSVNESTNWTKILYEELYFLKNTGAVNITDSEITFISQLGCCGVYENGKYASVNNCTETFSVPIVDNVSTWWAVLLSFAPALIILLYFVWKDWTKMFVIIIGCAGWVLAYFLRYPLLSAASNFNIIAYLVIASALAGIFEETVRYFIMKYYRKAADNPVILGLGWGIAEAVILYALYLAWLLMQNQAITLMNALPGAFERITATLLHVALSLIVVKGLKNRKYLYLGMLVHFLVNIVAVMLASILLLNVWLVEGIILIMTICAVIIACKVNEKGVLSVIKRKSAKRHKRK